MAFNKKYGIIIQARNRSSRLYGKMVIPFYKGTSMLEILLTKLKEGLNQTPIIVATTNDIVDKSIVDLVKEIGVHVYKGEENNVLQRMIDAASMYKVDNIIRVCADNPFLSVNSIIELISCHKKKPVDYISFLAGDEKPAILSHFGFFAELVTKSALIKVATKTNDSYYLEHVTNYIYTNPNEFVLSFLKAPPYLFNRQDIRLTVDTIHDFKLAQSLYTSMIENNWTQKDLINFIDSNMTIKISMNKMIAQNKK